jgi:hypothetical protein
MVRDQFFCDWCVFFDFLFNPIKYLHFTIVIHGEMRSGVPGIVQPLPEGHLNRRSWTIECSREGLDGNWNLLERFGDIFHECRLEASQFHSVRIRFFLQEFTDQI